MREGPDPVSPDRDKFKRALDRLLAAHGDWARYRWSAKEAERERMAEVAEAAERTVMELYDRAASREPVVDGEAAP